MVKDISRELRSYVGSSSPPVDFQDVDEQTFKEKIIMPGISPEDKPILKMSSNAVKMHADFMYGGEDVYIDFGKGNNENWINLKECLLVVPGNKEEMDWAE